MGNTPEKQGFAAGQLALAQILVPIDFSPSSRKALGYATALARQFGAEIFMLHVMEIFYPPPELAAIDTPQLEERALTDSKSELASLSSQIPGVVVATTVERGTPHQVIVDAARRRRVDLIVIGNRGRSGLEHFLLGSTAERVVRDAPCPVLVVRESEHDFLSTLPDEKPKPKEVS